MAGARYLVTGSAGFIGSRVSSLLLADGHEVVGLDNLNEAYDVRLKNWRLKKLLPIPGFSFIHSDICERENLESLLAKQPKLDAIINLAARAGVRQSIDDPWVYFETNCTGTLNLLNHCVNKGIEKFVQASTSSVYGDCATQPFHENLPTDQPLSPYAASKKACEALCHSYHHLYGLDISVLRYFTVYGPAGRPDMSLFRFVRWINEGEPIRVFGDGSQSRDFTYIDDIARGTIAALKKLGWSVINLGSDSPLELNQAIALVELQVGRKAIIKYEPKHVCDVSRTWANISRAREVLKWEPKVPINEGIGKLTEWYHANSAWAQKLII